jgi:tellurite resistance protein
MLTNLRLKNFPVSFYSITLGLAGFTVAWQKAEHLLKWNFGLSSILFDIVLILFTITTLIYLTKWTKFPQEVKNEFNDPVKINFYPIIAKVLLLISIIFLNIHSMQLSKIFWILGVIAQLTFTLTILSFWMHKDKFELKHISPAIFMPIVGNVLIPIAGVHLYSPEISWFFFSIGLIFWLIFTTIVLNRVMFHRPLKEKLMPTFFILMAPPAVAFIAYVQLTGHIDISARLLYYFSMFIFILLLVQVKYFSKIKFYLSSWAYSFPMDAFVIASFLMLHKTHWAFMELFVKFAFILLNILILVLIFKTFQAINKKEICIEENE